MSVSLWRIGTTRGTYRADDLSGAGAAKAGGRFNSVGTSVVYTSVNVSLTVLETVVHFGVGARAQSNKYLVEILVPDAVYAARKRITLAELRASHPFWDAIPFSAHAQPVGDSWVASGASLLLELPSAIMPHAGVPDQNVLINPAHADFSRIGIARTEKYIYDPRLTLP